MDLLNHGMKGPSRPAPAVPGATVNRYSPVTNWNDDPFGTNVFEPMPQYGQKKQPPPRPPPPKMNTKQPDIPSKPSHFIRKPTVLSSLLSRKNNAKNPITVTNQNYCSGTPDCNSELDTHKMFPKCEPKNIQTGTLIDLSSPPSSPTFTTRSSSDGLSVDSFGSDATTSTNHHNVMNGGNASQAESGFEDDFDLFLNSRKTIPKEDTLDDFTTIDPFSPQPMSKPPVLRKPVVNKDIFEISSQPANPSLKGPTIIRAKPARPKPPDNSALLKNTLGNAFPVITMNVNTTTPLQKVYSTVDPLDSKSLGWDEESSPEREWSPPMPCVPPPPPPLDAAVTDTFTPERSPTPEPTEPYAIALFDYFTDHPDDLCFSVNSRISLLRRVDDEWLYGRTRSGIEGVFPANYVYVKVPLPEEAPPRHSALALYDFEPDHPEDLRLRAGDDITLLYKINDEWHFGECNGHRGQFPINYVQIK